MSATELSRHYPGRSWRALRAAARRAGASRPQIESPVRQKVIRVLLTSPGISVVEAANYLGLSCDVVRKVVYQLHKGGHAHIVGYRNVAALYAFGSGRDMTRAKWSSLSQSERQRYLRSLSDDAFAQLQGSRRARILQRDPLMIAFYGMKPPATDDGR